MVKTTEELTHAVLKNREYSLKSYHKNKDAYLAQKKEYYANHRDIVLTKVKDRYYNTYKYWSNTLLKISI